MPGTKKGDNASMLVQSRRREHGNYVPFCSTQTAHSAFVSNERAALEESRYIRQEMLPQIGTAGQAALAQARVALVGMGALGSLSASVLARSGVGHLRLIDRDVVSLSNLQRCALYTEADARTATPKALAAAAHLSAINSTTMLEPHVVDVSSKNVLELLADVDLVLDGSDTFELRYLINEAADKLSVPWLYTGVLGMLGIVMPILPQGPCLRCLFSQAPAPGSYPTCTTDGILATTVRIAANVEASLAIKYLVDRESFSSEISGGGTGNSTLYQLDSWSPSLDRITVEKDRGCPVCGAHRYTLL